MKRCLHWSTLGVLGLIWIQSACDDTQSLDGQGSHLESSRATSVEDQAANQGVNQIEAQGDTSDLEEITDEEFWSRATLQVGWRDDHTSPLSLGEQRAYRAQLYGGDGRSYDVSASLSLRDPSTIVAMSAGALQGIGKGHDEVHFTYVPPPALGARTLEASLRVQVSDSHVSHLWLTPDPIAITEAQTLPLGVTVFDRQGLAHPLNALHAVTWETSHPALYVEQGVLHWDSSQGEVTSGWVKAQLSGWSAQAQVLTGSASADRVDIQELSTTPIRVGDQGRAQAQAWRGAEEVVSEIRWMSSHPEILYVDPEGRWEALRPGSANLIAATTGIWGVQSVTIRPQLELQATESDAAGEENWSDTAGADFSVIDSPTIGAQRQLNAADLGVVCGRVMTSNGEGALTPVRGVQASAANETLAVRRDELGVFCVYGLAEGALDLTLSVRIPAAPGESQAEPQVATATAALEVSAGQLTWLSDWIIVDQNAQALESVAHNQELTSVTAGLNAQDGGAAPQVCLANGWLWIATETEIELWSVHQASAPLRLRAWSLDTPALELACHRSWGAWRTVDTAWSARVDHVEASEVQISSIEMNTITHLQLSDGVLYAGTQFGVTYQYDLSAHQAVRLFARNALLPVTSSWISRDHLYVGYRDALLVYDFKNLTERYIAYDTDWNLGEATHFDFFEVGEQLIYRGDTNLRSCHGSVHLLESCEVITPNGGTIATDDRLFIVAAHQVLSVGANGAQLWRVDESGWVYERDSAHPQISQLRALSDGLGVFVDGAQVSVGAWYSDPDEVGALTLTPTTCPADDPALCAQTWSKSRPLEWHIESDWIGVERCEVDVNGQVLATPCTGRLQVPSALLDSTELNVVARAYSASGAIYEEVELITLVEITEFAPRLLGTSVRSGVYLPQVNTLYIYHSAPVTYADPSLSPVRLVDLGEDNRFENGYTEDQVIEVARLRYIDALGATRVEFSAPLQPSYYLVELRRDFEDYSGNHAVYSNVERFEVSHAGGLDRDWDCLPDALEDASDISHVSVHVPKSLDV